MTKKELREEFKKLAAMAPADRIGYLWEYYRVPLLLAALVLFLIFQAAGALWRGSYDVMLYAAFVDEPSVSSEQAGQLQDAFRNYETLSDKKQTIVFDTGMELQDASVQNASLIRLQSLLHTDTLDLVIGPDRLGDTYASDGIFLDWASVLPAEWLDALQDRLIYMPSSTEEAESSPKGVLGIRLAGSRLSELVPLSEDCCLYLCSTNHHPEVIVDFIGFSFSLENAEQPSVASILTIF